MDTVQVSGSSQEVRDEIICWLGDISAACADADGESVVELELRHGAEVYCELIYLLCHLYFPANEAKAHWRSVVGHRAAMSESLGTPVDLRVAVLDYFISVNRQFINPKIIEIKIFQKTLESAIRDELTGLFNYAYFIAELERECARAKRSGNSLSVAILDVDHFKWYNDHNGHLEGNNALRKVADLLQTEVRRTDVLARYGGEEFAVIFPDTAKQGLLKITERMRARIADEEFLFGEEQPGGRLSVSCGVATFSADGDEAIKLLGAADRALYIAKAQGRNQVVAAGEENRRHVRIETRIHGTVRTLSAESPSVLTSDISQEGLCFESAARMELGDYFRVSLALPDGGGDVAALVRVVRVEDAADGYSVAGRFVDLPCTDASLLRRHLGRVASAAQE